MARNTLAQPVDEPRQPSRVPQRGLDRVTDRMDERRLERPSNDSMTGDGKFAIDMARVPDGYVMEFKAHTAVGFDMREYRAKLGRYHWKPVPHKMQPHFYGGTCKNEDEHIIIGGQGLYMRPKYLNDDAEQESRDMANDQINNQVQSLRLNSDRQVGKQYTKIKRTRESVQQPVE